MTSRAGSITYTFHSVTKCDMCGSSSFRQLGMRLNRTQGMEPRKADGIAVSVKQCRDCDLIFSDPQPVPRKLSDHYGLPADDYWAPDAFARDESYLSDEIETAKRLLSFRPGMSALDIGAGLGKAMLSLSAAGFEAWGIEPSQPFYRRAVQNVGSERLLMLTLENADFPAASFDFITFGAVLEHLYSPSAALAKAMEWLKPGGIIHAEVPNAHHLVAKIINAYFRLRGTNYVTHISPMHPPFHLYEFSLRSFKNYKVAGHKFMVCSIINLPRFTHPALRWWMERTNTGMQLTVYLRR
jgi:2-polyprenyl-3-methyl-5-hydroxy-6-metoxy-1,4-benzoquinol methylase